jgi:glycosyltransferase involved in cell wall biosynthesis
MHAVTRRLIPLAYPKASSVIAVSEGVRAELISLQPALSERIKVLPTPVLSPDVRRQGEQVPPHPWFAERRAPVILSAGRLERHKGMFELVRAFAAVRKWRDAKMIIIGEGSARAALEAEVRRLNLTDDVDLPGFQQNPFSFMNHANLFVLNSYYEGLPNVLIQAMSFGTPIVSTDCKSGPSEILQGGRFGRLIPVGSHESLVASLMESLDLPKHRAAQESAWNRYGAEEATSAYLACANLPEKPR